MNIYVYVCKMVSDIEKCYKEKAEGEDREKNEVLF